jgi:pyruvate formate lyase activating enzyme
VIKLRTFLDTLSNVVSIEVLPYHTKGITKWEQMGLKYELLETPEPSEELIKHVETILKSNYQYMN